MIGTFNFKVENDFSIYLAKRAFLRQNLINRERERDVWDVSLNNNFISLYSL